MLDQPSITRHKIGRGLDIRGERTVFCDKRDPLAIRLVHSLGCFSERRSIACVECSNPMPCIHLGPRHRRFVNLGCALGQNYFCRMRYPTHESDFGSVDVTVVNRGRATVIPSCHPKSFQSSRAAVCPTRRTGLGRVGLIDFPEPHATSCQHPERLLGPFPSCDKSARLEPFRHRCLSLGRGEP